CGLEGKVTALHESSVLGFVSKVAAFPAKLQPCVACCYKKRSFIHGDFLNFFKQEEIQGLGSLLGKYSVPIPHPLPPGQRRKKVKRPVVDEDDEEEALNMEVEHDEQA
ncbi:hypothetical protein F8388_019269, partial [Cannabis sativa]